MVNTMWNPIEKKWVKCDAVVRTLLSSLQASLILSCELWHLQEIPHFLHTYVSGYASDFVLNFPQKILHEMWAEIRPRVCDAYVL